MSWELNTEDEIERFALWIVDQNTVEKLNKDEVISSIEDYFLNVNPMESDSVGARAVGGTHLDS